MQPNHSFGPPPMNDITRMRNPIASPQPAQAAPAPVPQPAPSAPMPPSTPTPSMDIQPNLVHSAPPQPMQAAPTAPAPMPGLQPMMGSTPPQSIPIATATTAEMVQNIPVKMPNAPSPQPVGPSPAAPVAPNFAAPAPNPMPNDDSGMDQVLQAVNNSVKIPEPAVAKASKISNVKDKAKKAVQPKPSLVVGLAVVACISLILAAFFAFRGGDTAARQMGPEVKLVGTSANASDTIKAGGGSLVTPQDIDDFTSSSKSQVSGLNDTKDFNTNDLSDSTLGL